MVCQFHWDLCIECSGVKMLDFCMIEEVLLDC